MNPKSMRDQLKSIKPVVTQSTMNDSGLPFTANAWLKDGVDHINIARFAKTMLGKVLNLDYVRSWDHPVLGPFRSLNSLWFFLRARNRTDAIRNMTGGELRNFVDERCGGFGDHLPNFRGMILDSMYRRAKSCNEIQNEIIRSVLPFDSYRENEAGIRIRFEHSSWITAGYEEIRNALKEQREPDFGKTAGFIEGDANDVYRPFLNQLVRKASPEEIEELLLKKKRAEKKLKQHLKRQQRRQEIGNQPTTEEVQPTSTLGAIQDIDSVEPEVVKELLPETNGAVEEPVQVIEDQTTQPEVVEEVVQPVVEEAAEVLEEKVA